MKRVLTSIDIDKFPSRVHPILKDAPVYDSSCSRDARVWFIDKDNGYFLKRSKKGSLKNEALMTDYFHKKGLSSPVLEYFSDDEDWLLTERVAGEDCIFEVYLSDPKRLCDTIAERLRMLHELDASDCPIQNRNEVYIQTAFDNYTRGCFDVSLFDGSFVYSSADEAFKIVDENKHRLKCDVLLHGDYCLPNILLNDWRFSGFIDLGNGGVGDRHIDLFWGAWTLNFNLHTEEYRDRFYDAYGRDKIQPEMIDVIAAFEVFG
ncbi:MAG: aminoglycoside 3'-phosphotransferase [Clostridia bacterium]|nr:aminoglycoside 3'-phosphotransferase [Clostridia bacterium]